jgi:hypothetical protein
MPPYLINTTLALGPGKMKGNEMEQLGTGGESRNEKLQPPGERRPGPDGHFALTVNDISVKFAEERPRGEQILDKAGLKPADDYVLIQMMRHSSRSIALDETVNLREEGTETFRAFKSDRIYRFTVNEHGFDWGVDKIPEPELRAICHIPAEDVLVLERDGADIDLTPTDVLDLGRAGTEHLHTEKCLVRVFFENVPREIPRGTYTTEQLKDLFKVQAGYVLEVINEEGQLTPLKPGEKLRVKEGMKFFEQVPCGGSS